MSKATDWAPAGAESERPVFIRAEWPHDEIARVTVDEVRLYLHKSYVTPAEALRLAAWIVDTFGEP